MLAIYDGVVFFTKLAERYSEHKGLLNYKPLNKGFYEKFFYGILHESSPDVDKIYIKHKNMGRNVV